MRLFLLTLLLSATLFAQKAPFASQADLTVDLSDAIFANIYSNSLDCLCCNGWSLWAQGIGDFRSRGSSSHRERYDNWFGGIMGGANFGFCDDSCLGFFLGGSLGEVDIQGESNFDSESIFFGISYERLCDFSSFGLALAGGYLREMRHFHSIHEEPRGLFLTPEFTFSSKLSSSCLSPIFSASLRYAGFFSHDYEHRETPGTLYVRNRSLQLLTLRGELASSPFSFPRFCLEPYIGLSGRFQVDGNHIHGRLLLNNESFSQGVDQSLAYGLVGMRVKRECGSTILKANIEGDYDTDRSWRVFGGVSYAF